MLIAHNAPFDIGLLRKSEAEMQVAWDHPVLDTVLLSASRAVWQMVSIRRLRLSRDYGQRKRNTYPDCEHQQYA